MSSEAVKVIIRNNWRRISIEIYSFFRVKGSFDKWCWLAISIRGRSHVVSANSGADRESEKNIKEEFNVLSFGWFR